MLKAALALALAGCSGGSHGPADLSATADLQDLSVGAVQLYTPTETRPLDSYFSLAGINGTIAIVITFVDRSFVCTGPVPSTVDVMSVLFPTPEAGATSDSIAVRSGPTLGAASDPAGSANIDVLAVRATEIDGGFIVGDNGRVSGGVAFTFAGGVSVRGSFEAPHCAPFDYDTDD
jgi:hypothetical protein